MPWSARLAERVTKLEWVVASSRDQIIENILEIVQSESQQTGLAITMDTPVKEVGIDSVDVINILFRLEDEYGVSIDLDIQSQPETVGDLVNALIEFIPQTDAAK